MNNTSIASPKYPVVFVLGIAHSGSTLLGRLLDMHSRILCVGELMRIDEAMAKAYPCSCGKPIETCDFWLQYVKLIQDMSDLNFKRFDQNLYEKLNAISGHDVSVDLSKTRVIRMMRSALGTGRRKFKDAGFILLLRDPKGIRASALRRKDAPIDQFLQRYLKWMKRFQKFAARQGSRMHILKYEDLCRQPKHEMGRLCDFMGIDYESAMVYPAMKTHHFIHSSTSRYLKDINSLVIDERWRQELKETDIIKIQKAIDKLDLLRNAYATA